MSLQAPFPWFGGRGGTGDDNRHRERIYLSPGCIAGDNGLLDLLDGSAS